MSTGKKRQSNFELLRIIAMFLIILQHTVVHGSLSIPANIILDTSNIWTYVSLRYTGFFGKVGVYLFVLITGYFMYNKSISVKKLVKLWLPIFFWATLMTIVIGVYYHQLNWNELLKSAFPIFNNRYWFMTTYVFMYLLIPLLNLVINQMSRRQIYLMFWLGLIILAPGTRLYGSWISSYLLYFCYVYVVGGTIRKHQLLARTWIRNYGWALLLGSLLVDLLLVMVFGKWGFTHQNENLVTLTTNFVDVPLFTYLVALGLFVVVGTRKMNYYGWINKISATTFGIYLIHDNQSLRYILWHVIFKTDEFRTQLFYIAFLETLGITVLVFVVCSLLEFGRQLLFSKGEDALANWLDNIVQNCDKSRNNVSTHNRT